MSRIGAKSHKTNRNLRRRRLPLTAHAFAAARAPPSRTHASKPVRIRRCCARIRRSLRSFQCLLALVTAHAPSPTRTLPPHAWRRCPRLVPLLAPSSALLHSPQPVPSSALSLPPSRRLPPSNACRRSPSEPSRHIYAQTLISFADGLRCAFPSLVDSASRISFVGRRRITHSLR